MNEKPQGVLRSILHKSWHEPRHFFFWLALFSPFVFAMVVLMVGTAGEIPPFIHWIALATILGFILGVPAFILSLIPPLRPIFTWLVRHKFLVAASILTLIAMFYAIENWRGRNAWNSFQRQWEAQGVQFAVEKIIPAPIPAAENMFEAEPWVGLHFTTTNGVRFQNTNFHSQPLLDCSGPKSANAPSSGGIFRAQATDLAEWQRFYRGTNNQFTAADGTITNYFPVASTPQTPAHDVLLALSKFADQLTQIRTAAERPQARFWINYEDGFSALLPHLSKMKGLANYLRLRAAALLAEGQTDAALTDILLSFRLNEAIRSEPTLISQLVRIAAFYINLTPVWEGLANHRWTEAQLLTLEGELAKADFLTDYQTGMNGERYFSIWSMDFLRRTGDTSTLFDSPEAAAGNSDIGAQFLAATGRILFRLVPAGWFDQNKLSLGQMHVEYIRPMIDEQKQLARPAISKKATAAFESFRPTPYNLFAGMLLPALDKAALKSATAQTYLNLARVAVALERHRLTHGTYPETLAALEPHFIAKLPHDVINGQPLHYRHTDDGSFILYSVGWNTTDDGGTVVRRRDKSGKESETVDPKQGDWVWRYPAD